MPGVNCRFSSSSSSSFSSWSSSQLSTPRTLENGFLHNTLCVSPRLSSHTNPSEKRSPKQLSSLGWDSEKANADKHTPSGDTLTPKSSAELRKEIVKLESEILRLERYLLSLYRTAFEEHIPSLSNVAGRNRQRKKTPPSASMQGNWVHRNLQKGGFIYHDQASSQCDMGVSDRPGFSSSLEASSGRDMKRTDSCHRSLADLLGVSHMIHNLDTPNRLSEEIMRCISSIYCKLSASSAQTILSLSNSIPSSLSSSSAFSSKNPCDSRSPRCSNEILINRHSDKAREGSVSDVAVVEVLQLSLDEDNFKCVEIMLRKFRSLVQDLEKADPRKMTREEKLAFWINIHNALLMHAYIAYGTRDGARSSSILKAAYNVGGLCINAYDIESSILAVGPHHSTPRLQTLFSPGRKSNTGCSKHLYALEYPEPLVHFALCSGASTEPMVRVYTAKSIFQELRQAKEEFIRANVYVENETKILLPKLLYYYAKDASLDIARLMDVITGSLSETQRKTIRKYTKTRNEKSIHWLSQVSSFRYVIHGELARRRTKI